MGSPTRLAEIYFDMIEEEDKSKDEVSILQLLDGARNVSKSCFFAPNVFLAVFHDKSTLLLWQYDNGRTNLYAGKDKAADVVEKFIRIVRSTLPSIDRLPQREKKEIGDVVIEKFINVVLPQERLEEWLSSSDEKA